jgi:hypothetical protein
MRIPDNYIEKLKTVIERLRSMLEPLETGKIRLSERKGNEPWHDVTQAQIDHLKRSIVVLQGIVDNPDA